MDVFLARQPIFDVNQELFAYEILYRSGNINKFTGTEGDRASTEVIINTFQTVGIDNLTSGVPVFINFTENLIHDEIATFFPNDLLVIEILENVYPHEEIMERVRELKDEGYRIALDDFINSPEYRPLVEIADIIKIDFMDTEKDEIEKILEEFKDYDLKFLAEKVETREEVEYARELGFDYFQGYFFSKPEIVKSKKILPMQANYIQLIDEISEPEIDFMAIAKIISRDLSLTYNLLRLVNSGAFGFRYRITGVQHALAALGERKIRNWIYLIILNDMGDERPDELTRISLIRARFLEILSSKTRYRVYSEEMFLIGLFSLLDVILSKPMEDVLLEISASDMVKEALLQDRGEGAILYKTILAYEEGNWDRVIGCGQRLNIEPEIIGRCYIEALRWYRKIEN